MKKVVQLLAFSFYNSFFLVSLICHFCRRHTKCGIYYQLFFTRVPTFDSIFQIWRDPQHCNLRYWICLNHIFHCLVLNYSQRVFKLIFYALPTSMSMEFSINENHLFRWELSWRYTNVFKRTHHKKKFIQKMRYEFGSNNEFAANVFTKQIFMWRSIAFLHLCDILNDTFEISFVEDSASYVASYKWLDRFQNWCAKCKKFIWTPCLYIVDNLAKRITWNEY